MMCASSLLLSFGAFPPHDSSAWVVGKLYLRGSWVCNISLPYSAHPPLSEGTSEPPVLKETGHPDALPSRKERRSRVGHLIPEAGSLRRQAAAAAAFRAAATVGPDEGSSWSKGGGAHPHACTVRPSLDGCSDAGLSAWGHPPSSSFPAGGRAGRGTARGQASPLPPHAVP